MWLRLYTDILNDPKVQRLTPEDFKGWINILCLAKENGGLIPPLEDAAFYLRMSDAEAKRLVEELTNQGLLDQTEDGQLEPHNWNKWQTRTCDLLRGDWAAIRLEVLERDNWLCRYCGAAANAVDHIIARTRGGTNDMENLVAACKPCNSRKRDRTPEEAGMSLIC